MVGRSHNINQTKHQHFVRFSHFTVKIVNAAWANYKVRGFSNSDRELKPLSIVIDEMLWKG